MRFRLSKIIYIIFITINTDDGQSLQNEYPLQAVQAISATTESAQAKQPTQTVTTLARISILPIQQTTLQATAQPSTISVTLQQPTQDLSFNQQLSSSTNGQTICGILNANSGISASFKNGILAPEEQKIINNHITHLRRWLQRNQLPQQVNIEHLNMHSQNLFKEAYVTRVDYFQLVLMVLNLNIAYSSLLVNQTGINVNITRKNIKKLESFIRDIAHDHNNERGYKNIWTSYDSSYHYNIAQLVSYTPIYNDMPSIIYRPIVATIKPSDLIHKNEQFENMYNNIITTLRGLGINPENLNIHVLNELNKDMYNPNALITINASYMLIIIATYQYIYEKLYNGSTDIKTDVMNLEILKRIIEQFKDNENCAINPAYMQTVYDLYGQLVESVV